MATAAFMSAYPLLLALFGSAPGHDALDAVPTATYWSAHAVTPTPALLKAALEAGRAAPVNLDQDIADLSSDQFKVRMRAREHLETAGAAAIEKLRPLVSAKDPEVAQAASELIDKASTSLRAREVRRLMAIRTLGENKDASALPALKGLADSKDLFVAEYAARASAAIEGKPYTPPSHEKALERDLALVPKDTRILGQLKGAALDPIAIDEVINDAAMFANPGRPVAGNAPAPETVDAMTKMVMNFFDAAGDFRVDGVTVAANPEAAGGPWTELILHGAYDQTALLPAVGATSGQPIDTIPSAALEPGVTVLMPSSDEMVIVFTGDPAPFAAALHDPAKAGIGGNDVMTGLLKKADQGAPFWAIVQVGPVMKSIPMFTAFETISFTSAKSPDGAVSFSAAGEATDATAAADSVKSLNAQVAATAASIQQEVAMAVAESAGLAPLGETMQSIHATSDGVHAAMTGIAPHTLSHFTAMGAAATIGQQERRAEIARRQQQGNAATAP